MNKELLIELFGYLGSFLVLISFLTTSLVKLRVINTIGSLIFMIYALIIHSYPTALMNGFLIIINIHHIVKESQIDKEYDIIDVDQREKTYVYFFELYLKDIRKYYPDTDFNRADCAWMIVNQGRPVGLSLGKRNGEQLELLMDYTIENYRDFSIADKLYDHLKASGIKTIIFNAPQKNYQNYLKRFDYHQEGEYYLKDLS